MKLLFYVSLLFCICTTMQAQVTIGSSEKSNSGSLLDLKENNNVGANTSRGLALPRVKLTDKNKLYPMLASGYAPAEDANHTGLVVYHTEQCTMGGKGLFVWNGDEWQALTNEKSRLQTETPANSNRADWTSAWGTKVILHQAKAGVYEEFTSADFGVAGRWMTTNLAAKAYDGITHSQSPARTLIGPSGNTDGVYNTAYWCYPSATSPTTATEYNANKSLGLLYTWDAATAGKGGITGYDWSNEVGIDHAKVQGICPEGWHVPSDYEWTDLENVIMNKTSLYSSLPDINPSNAKSFPYYYDPVIMSQRGWLLQSAMTEACDTKSGLSTNGASKPASQGGFAALLEGYFYSGSAQHGIESFFISSSSYVPSLNGMKSGQFIMRDLISNPTFGARASIGWRYWLCTVRCKKDQ